MFKYSLIFKTFWCALFFSLSSSGMELPEATGITIENYNEQRDLPAVATVFQKDWNNLYLGREYSIDLVKALLAPSPGKKIKVIRANALTAGFITYYFQADRKLGYVELMAVDQENRRKGFGSQLLVHALEKLQKKDATETVIYVKKTNDIAMNLYAKLGFSNEKQISAIRDLAWELHKPFTK